MCSCWRARHCTDGAVQVMSHRRRDWEERYRGQQKASDVFGSDASPSDFLVAHADLIRGHVLEVAAGAGRNALFLARRGCVVELVDISHDGLRQAHEAALAAGLTLLPIQADLETFPLPRSRYDAVINIRYLQRSLFEPLQEAVKPGGVILFETFLADQRSIGHPRNPEFLLQRGELRTVFARCEILVYEEGLFHATTRPCYLARLLARRIWD